MLTVVLSCPVCRSARLVRNGRAADGRQRYLGRACGRRSRELPRTKADSEARRQEILDVYQERASWRGLTRVFGVSRSTVAAWIPKKRKRSGRSARP